MSQAVSLYGDPPPRVLLRWTGKEAASEARGAAVKVLHGGAPTLLCSRRRGYPIHLPVLLPGSPPFLLAWRRGAASPHTQ